MESAEASGKTVEDALKKALARLGARRDEVELTVLDEGKSGFLGVGAREARVRIDRLKGPLPEAEPGPVDTRIPHAPQRMGGDRGGRRGAPPARGGGDRPRGGGGSRAPQSGGGQRGGAPRGRRGGGSLEAAEPKLTVEDFLRPRGETPSADTSAGGDERRGAPRGGRPRAGKGTEAPSGERRERGDRGDRGEGGRRPPREEQPYIAPDINAEEVDFAAQIVDDMLRILDINAEITIREPLSPGDGLGASLAVIDISGDDLGLLIGRKGDTLYALQYIVNLMLGRRYPNKGGITIDVEHYRHRREEQVISLARRMADRVRQTGSAITLEPMPAAERRLIHLAFADDPDLETNSIGEGESRKVVISARR